MKKKETVIVFDGEDAFINHRNVIYDKRKGKSTFVGQDGSISSTPTDGKSQETNPDSKSVGHRNTVEVGTDTGNTDGGPSNPTDTGVGDNKGNALMPDPSDPAFCDKIQMFITTNGNGTATPAQIMGAQSAFQTYCKRVPPPTDTGDGTGKGTDTNVGDTPPAPRGPRPPRLPVKLPDKAPSKGEVVATTTVVAPIIPESLGLPIAPQSLSGRGGAAGGGAGGGGGEQKKEVKKQSYWWILIVLAAAGGMYYYSRRKN